jgi:hypothetical protein
MSAPPPAHDQRLLAIALGQRLEAAEQGLRATEAALRHLAHDVADSEVWLARAQASIARARDAMRWLPPVEQPAGQPVDPDSGGGADAAASAGGAAPPEPPAAGTAGTAGTTPSPYETCQAREANRDRSGRR